MEKLHFTHIQCLLVETCTCHIHNNELFSIQYLGHMWRQLWTNKANAVMVDGGIDSWDHCGSWR